MSSSQAERQNAILARNKEQLGVLQENWPLRWVMMRTSHPETSVRPHAPSKLWALPTCIW